VAVVSDLMRVAREIVSGNPQRVSPFAHSELAKHMPVSIADQVRAHYLRFRVKDQPGIIGKLGSILAAANISLDAVLQLPSHDKNDLPFVITVEPTTEHAVHEAVSQMRGLDFLVEEPLALPMEQGLEKAGAG
jgi:homoserine dehydrogenase